ncbi:exodeoxyribonuclease V subunit gamma [uncultured Psychrobacter sp.]|uniref:exodeoxyribonuclease V subunit gamma n=1 Tax=uncultured Psychrobacter sp. TaxID=259303 RepID=UPI002637BC30|nr:exodeoxyribonuclease V subunit gamma [uncultured Psychrobacter sp.]
MFTIIQSHRTETLVEQLLEAYKSKNQPIFEEFVVIVPSMVLGDWLDKSIASQAGISTLVTTTFWGQYQWTLMQKVLAEYNVWLEEHQRTQEIITVPEVAVLTGSVMQWRLFGYFTYYQAQIMTDDKHPLYPLLSALIDDEADRSQQEARLWSLATDFSRVFGRYLNHREEWLTLWSQDKAVDVETLVAEKDKLTLEFDQYAGMTPEWLVAHYVELEAAQRHLWRLLFASVYEHRSSIERRFWEVMTKDSSETGVDIKSILPTQLHIFTIQQLPQNELDFLQRLSKHLDITLLHYNPSQLFWADIVDKQWLQRQQVINPESVFLRDYGHTLLSRLGKQSRETFAMLAGLSGNEDKDGFVLDWQDRFDIEDEEQTPSISSSEERPMSLLAHLQQDVLMLDEGATQQVTAGRLSAALGAQLALNLEDSENQADVDSLNSNEVNSLSNDNHHSNQHIEQWYSDDALKNKYHEQPRQWNISQYDNSLSIHSCHNLQRQLEVLRGMIGRWLNEANDDGSTRQLSDIVVLLPDVERHHDLITSVFVQGRGQDGLTLPAKVTGVVDKSIRQLWEAISGFYSLLGSDTARFEAAVVMDWLMLPPLYESLGLTHEQMSRGCDLLEQAGFVRGFDEAHLQQTLDTADYDYRFSFAHALDQIALGLVMPEVGISDCLYPDNWQDSTLAEKTVPISAISLNDAPIVEALCRVHAGLNMCRHDYQASYQAEDWLDRIENSIIHPYFGSLDQTRPMRAIFNAMNGFKSSLRANRHYQRYHTQIDAQSDTELTSSSASTSTGELNAAQVEAQLSRVSTLPLKLSFMLSSIEDELESQQVSAEPTGVITFGRFGALRNVPFGLVVMLNMDLSEFPNRDRDNRYDLMKAGLAKRGDRFSEDDDNGAFLDAVLCARNACWIFYNGQRLTDTHEHLPANPVSELLQFLRGEVQWQWDPLKSVQKYAQDDLTAQLQRYLPELIEKWLVTRHPALPFADEVFVQPDSPSTLSSTNPNDENDLERDNEQDKGRELIQSLEHAMQSEKLYQKSTNAPAKVWQAVFERLQAQIDTETPNRAIKVVLPSKDEYAAIAAAITQPIDLNAEQNELLFDVQQVDMQHLYYEVRHPAKHFLKEQQVHVVLPTEDTLHQEPLALTGLGAYAVNAQLLTDLYASSYADDEKERQRTTKHLSDLLFDRVMPAGVARQSTLQYQQLKITQQCQDFAEQLTALGIDVHTGMNSEVGTEQCLTLLTPCAEKMVSVQAPAMNAQGQLQIKGVVPLEINTPDDSISPKLWLNILPNSARTQHLLRFWLSHVYWQVSRRTTEAQVTDNDGRSIWRFSKGSDEYKKFKGKASFALAPIDYNTALAELLKWVRFAQIASTTPMTVLPVHAMTYLEKLREAEKRDASYQPKRSDFEGWLWAGFNNDVIYDTCAQHEIWQYILQNQDAFTALTDALPSLAQPLFEMMVNALEPL